MPVIDFHVHPSFADSFHPWVLEWMARSFAGDFRQFCRTYSNRDRFLELMEENGVDYAVIVAENSPVTTGITSNRAVIDFCKDKPGLIPFANINPFVDAQPVRLLENLVEKEGIRGVKMYPTYQFFYPNDARLYPLYAKARELGIPIMFHTGSSIFKGSRIKYGNPVYFDDVAVDFPGLTLIMSHSGRGFWYREAFFLSRIHQNLYMEIAGLPPKKLLTYFPEFERNTDKIIFGSDWPGVSGVKENIADIRALPISKEQIEKILWANAAKILKIT